jgi:hypothetical protein
VLRPFRARAVCAWNDQEVLLSAALVWGRREAGLSRKSAADRRLWPHVAQVIGYREEAYFPRPTRPDELDLLATIYGYGAAPETGRVATAWAAERLVRAWVELQRQDVRRRICLARAMAQRFQDAGDHIRARKEDEQRVPALWAADDAWARLTATTVVYLNLRRAGNSVRGIAVPDPEATRGTERPEREGAA